MKACGVIQQQQGADSLNVTLASVFTQPELQAASSKLLPVGNVTRYYIFECVLASFHQF